MTLMAAFKTVLMRYGGGEDLSVGTPIANRTRREVEGLIGFFVNTLVLRTDLSGNPSFRELIRREREVALGAYAHQEAPFEKLVEEINPDRDLSRNPLFQVMMVLENVGRSELGIRGLKTVSIKEEKIGQEAGVAKFDLTLALTESIEGIAGSMEYSLDLYEGETIRRMARHYEKALEEIVRDPEQRIGEIELMCEVERRQIIEEWNATEREYGDAPLAHELIAEQARRRPEGLAVVYEQEQISYRELNERANRLAHYLRELGVGPEVMVGVCLERSIEMVVGLLGILKAGGAYLPMDPTYPDGRLSMMVEDAKVRILLTGERLAKRFSERSMSLICLDSDWITISTRSPEDLPAQVKPDNTAYVIYTSGSTGRPKGVVVTHRSVLNLFKAIDEKLYFSQDDVWTMFHSYSFDFSVWEMWGALICGGALVVVPYLVARTPEEFYHLVQRHGVTVLNQTPSGFRQFMKVDEAISASLDTGLRTVIFGGEALELNSLKGWLKRHGDEPPQLINMYGITETTVHTTYKRVTNEDLGESTGSVIGKPLANMRMYVLDEQLRPVPVGVVGELYVAGTGMSRGYLGREELTAERFIPADCGKPGERIYKTGDLVKYLRDGNIEYLGRKDHQVKIRGYRIELGEIERALEQVEGIQETVVVLREENSGDKRLVAYVVAEGEKEEETQPNKLREYLKKKLPDYMTPSAIVLLEKMPLTPNGKLDRKALPSPRQERVGVEPGYMAPRTPIEEDVARIFCEVLGFEEVGIYDDFFALGGHSLLATKVISRISNAFQIELSVRALFDAPTVNGLVAAIVESQAGQFEDDALLQMLADLDGLPENERNATFND
jgi:amino acid adenylation domain-containing protein